MTGIREAHQEASRVSESEFFFVVDGDNKIRADFHFQPPSESLRFDTLYVWRCLNPANGLQYGYGAIKLYNKLLLERRNESSGYLDLATSAAEHYQIVPVLASETHFFSTPLEAWQGAFRECTKLASELIRGQKSSETQNRLNRWCESCSDVPNRHWILTGARSGREFALSRPLDEVLYKINDYSWLQQRFVESGGEI